MSGAAAEIAIETAQVTAVLSMLHELPPRNSATRLFRGKPVLGWTLNRLQRASRVGSVAIVCWEDQLEAVLPIAEQHHADVLAKGPRVALPELEAVAAARRWADGWRGGLLGTCEFDRGFHAGWFAELGEKLGSDAILVIDPSAGLIDAGLLDEVVEHAETHDAAELVFMPSAPGLSAPLLRMSLLNRLAAARTHAGRLLHYTPDGISREPLGGEACVPLPGSVARTTARFTLDSDRQVERIATATHSLNGTLISSPAEAIVARMHENDVRVDELPREIVLELNTTRASTPIYWPGRYRPVARSEMSIDAGKRLIDEIAACDDARLTIAGVGDPLLSDSLLPLIDHARAACVAVHVETDLIRGDVAALARSEADVVSVHVPALTPQTYATVMGVDRYAGVLENVRTFVAERARRSRGVPILAPTFTKCRENLGEMEAWYDQWLRAVGSAVISGASDFAGQIPSCAVADMAPPKRRPCARLRSRLVVQSDGGVVACEQDFAGQTLFGRIGEIPLKDIWQHRLAALRADHRCGSLSSRPLCVACREWHRP